MKKFLVLVLCMSIVAGVWAGGSGESAAEGPVELTFLFPVQVAGPQAALMSNIVSDFNDAHPDIYVEAVYSGNYDQTVQRAITSSRGGNPPAVVVATSISLLEFLDMGLVEDLDQFMTEADADYAERFYPGFMANSMYEGAVWSVPFQRSLPVLYWNRGHFEQVGLDPDSPPTTWEEVIEYADALRAAPGQYSFVDITEDTWTIQALILQAGGRYSNDAGTEAYFDTQETREAFGFWNTLANEMRVMPRQRFYGNASQDFVAQETSMMVNSSGSFAFVADAAEFDFGITTLPGHVKKAYPTGGGNLYIFRGLSDAEQEAAWTFVKYMSSPEISARWAIETGYVPAQPAAYETPAMLQHIEKFPHFGEFAENLQFASKEMAFFSNSEIRETLRVTIADILLQNKTIDQGVRDLQQTVDGILAPYQE
jgi:sn-glycerol 3-phosphate transport system substrate-binding protein